MIILAFLLLGLFSLTDIKEHSINILVLAVFLTSSIIMMIIAVIFGDKVIYVSSSLFYYPTFLNVIKSLVPGIVLFLVSIISHEQIGRGDAYLVMVLGMMLGLSMTSLVVFVSMIIASVYGVLLMLLKKASRKYELPFIPFIFFSFLLTEFIKNLGVIRL